MLCISDIKPCDFRAQCFRIGRGHAASRVQVLEKKVLRKTVRIASVAAHFLIAEDAVEIPALPVECVQADQRHAHIAGARLHLTDQPRAEAPAAVCFVHEYRGYVQDVEGGDAGVQTGHEAVVCHQAQPKLAGQRLRHVAAVVFRQAILDFLSLRVVQLDDLKINGRFILSAGRPALNPSQGACTG